MLQVIETARRDHQSTARPDPHPNPLPAGEELDALNTSIVAPAKTGIRVVKRTVLPLARASERPGMDGRGGRSEPGRASPWMALAAHPNRMPARHCGSRRTAADGIPTLAHSATDRHKQRFHLKHCRTPSDGEITLNPAPRAPMPITGREGLGCGPSRPGVCCPLGHHRGWRLIRIVM